MYVLGLHKSTNHTNIQKLVKIADLAKEALLDTDSQITAMREDFYRLLGPPP